MGLCPVDYQRRNISCMFFSFSTCGSKTKQDAQKSEDVLAWKRSNASCITYYKRWWSYLMATNLFLAFQINSSNSLVNRD